MKGIMARVMAVVLFAAAPGGCAVTDAQRRDARADLSRSIADQAIAYNEAYSSAISGQILLNILRAKNRLPRQYMSMSGFSSDTPDSRQSSLSIVGVPLGELGHEWGQGAISTQGVVRDEPVYTVTPFAQDAFTRIATAPTSPSVLRHYWETGWNRDLLLFLLVDRMEIVAESGRRVVYNNPGTIAANCEAPGYDIGGCAFVREARELIRRTNREPAPTPPGGNCFPIATYGDAPTPASEACAPTIVVDGERYVLSLRSLDGMIYYVGELLRTDALHPASEGAAAEARLSVRVPGALNATTPLFRIVPATGETERAYAATVDFAGARYSAGAPADQFCFQPGNPNACDGVRGDRSSSVLEFLAGILAFNQSEASVRPPQNAIIR